MWKELLTAITIYLFVLGAHLAHKHYDAYKERKRREEADRAALDALSPLVRPVIVQASPHAHALAFAAGCVGPSCLEAFKHYLVHFLVYSGYVIPH